MKLGAFFMFIMLAFPAFADTSICSSALSKNPFRQLRLKWYGLSKRKAKRIRNTFEPLTYIETLNELEPLTNKEVSARFFEYDLFEKKLAALEVLQKKLDEKTGELNFFFRDKELKKKRKMVQLVHNFQYRVKNGKRMSEKEVEKFMSKFYFLQFGNHYYKNSKFKQIFQNLDSQTEDFLMQIQVEKAMEFGISRTIKDLGLLKKKGPIQYVKNFLNHPIVYPLYNIPLVMDMIPPLFFPEFPFTKFSKEMIEELFEKGVNKSQLFINTYGKRVKNVTRYRAIKTWVRRIMVVAFVGITFHKSLEDREKQLKEGEGVISPIDEDVRQIMPKLEDYSADPASYMITNKLVDKYGSFDKLPPLTELKQDSIYTKVTSVMGEPTEEMLRAHMLFQYTQEKYEYMIPARDSLMQDQDYLKMRDKLLFE
jgi:hypothetical protein